MFTNVYYILPNNNYEVIIMNQLPQVNPQQDFPGIFTYGDFNPTLLSPNSPFSIFFAQTRESLIDVDIYRRFLYSAITRFRTSTFYKHYKAHLINDLGMDRCQLHPYITVSGENEVASLEMHHHILTIFDIALIITEHVLNTYGSITTFDLAEMIRQEHEAHRVHITMLCKTCHARYSAGDPEFKIPSNIGFGKWWEFLERYKCGITRDIAVKIYYMLKNDLYNADERDKNIMEKIKLRDNILKWSEMNEKFYQQNTQPTF